MSNKTTKPICILRFSNAKRLCNKNEERILMTLPYKAELLFKENLIPIDLRFIANFQSFIPFYASLNTSTSNSTFIFYFFTFIVIFILIKTLYLHILISISLSNKIKIKKKKQVKKKKKLYSN